MTGPVQDSSRRPTLVGRLTRLGFGDASRAQTFLGDRDLVALAGEIDVDAVLVAELGGTADPDLALLGLVRLCAAARGTEAGEELGRLLAGTGVAAPPTRAAAHAPRRTMAGRAADDVDPASEVAAARGRLLAVLGASTALGDELVRRPRLVRSLADPTGVVGVPVADVYDELLRAVGADPDAAVPVAAAGGHEGTDALRRAYRARLLRIAATDLRFPDPLSRLPGVAAALADLAGAALEAALAVARADLPDHGTGVRLAVIGMGKTGGRELNYVSDVDVVYVVEPADGYDEDYATSTGTRLASGLTTVCGAPSGEPPLWAVDAALRPEGKQGPLVRTLASHLAYYERWAKTWEFQALLKARPVAGDAALGRAYDEAVNPLVWNAVQREHFVEDAQAMRRRVEAHVPSAEADRQIKLGKGGLRDVEFTVQLLQLVHGRADEEIRSPNTLTALAALSARGYVGRAHAAQLAVCYRFLRAVEHRVQLYRLRRTHLMPTLEADVRRLARTLHLRPDGPDGLMERWRSTRREVRTLHEELFYRPLLPATAQLSQEEASLAPEAARARLAAIGYRDPAGAMRHIQALTEGVSRRASIQRQLLPVMLGWFAEGADPDRGLLAFRKLSEVLGTSPWYLKLLRDSGYAARRLATLLSNSQYLADALARSPESVTWLDDDAELVPRDAARLAGEVDAILTRADESQPAATALRAVRRRELSRTGAAELLGTCESRQAQAAVSAAADVVLVGALRIAAFTAAADAGLDTAPAAAPARLLVVGMGRLGGQEMGYGSDADVLFVYEPVPGAEDAAAKAFALAVATRLRTVCSELGPEPRLLVDADLRPEGRNGPLVRSLASYAEYYGRWSAVWEAQALLRARPVAGDPALAQRFVELIDGVRYVPGGVDGAAEREVRRVKARVEAERLPRGVDPSRHLKLGRGGISDVEWTAQLLQLQHAGDIPALRTTQTIPALRAAVEADLLDREDADVLIEAWVLASRVRAANALWSGQPTGQGVDVLPHDRVALNGVAQAMRLDGTGSDLEDHYLRAARRCRAVVERVFYAAD
ncbi:bifunctional [glutamine synthetase] adenylyltransferase/[glutamine synthetase]-adenylyl-L-tyrosine phosphorylase [Luteimicrobium subarcticum]|uniref:Bifunctional glutamine synthetase adenylyltransferase/adenylyl-removing enzyme n=1 Tax=Luteimicrobium subarcticum TaxID=620910 RepID=A0A2M8WR98_9MICO|nr:bifunctional [glutamine synthetase] adenylyltransferase/[glutamine synthetase]-adenylyl-L-tyrosine phosphorylase [Luteimicrobium subarcticum]PJI93457.1 glutamate-ammonia-ligase adenylyltransferase [Luteimicrobium subarcticum]